MVIWCDWERCWPRANTHIQITTWDEWCLRCDVCSFCSFYISVSFGRTTWLILFQCLRFLFSFIFGLLWKQIFRIKYCVFVQTHPHLLFGLTFERMVSVVNVLHSHKYYRERGNYSRFCGLFEMYLVYLGCKTFQLASLQCVCSQTNAFKNNNWWLLNYNNNICYCLFAK